MPSRRATFAFEQTRKTLQTAGNKGTYTTSSPSMWISNDRPNKAHFLFSDTSYARVLVPLSSPRARYTLIGHVWSHPWCTVAIGYSAPHLACWTKSSICFTFTITICTERRIVFSRESFRISWRKTQFWAVKPAFEERNKSLRGGNRVIFVKKSA